MVNKAHTFSSEAINQWIAYYNKLVDKCKTAETWMSSESVPESAKMAEFLRYKCEVVDALRSYVTFFAAIGIKVEPGERIEAEAGA